MKTKSALPLLAAPATVRRRFFAALVLPLLATVFFPATTHAQTSTSAVPNLISYQGKVSNANGTLVGAGTPVNRIVVFRIWSHQSNSTINDLVYSEQQTVTVSEGEFSVLIGQGSVVSGTPLGYSESSKNSFTALSVFGGATRYLGVTIDDGNGVLTNDPEISPRQQLVSSAFAMRAKYAESLGSNGASTIVALDTGNVGIGAANPGAKLDVAGNVRAGGVVNASFVLANADNNPVGAIGTASSVGSFSTDAAVNDVVVRAGAGKLLLQSGVGASAITIDTSNRVGIGTSAPNAALDVNGALMVKGALTNTSSRPAVGTSRVAAEIGGYGSGGAANDDGFLRLSAGGGTTATAKSFIDVTGFSNVADMNNTLVFGTAGAERLRISNTGALLLKGGLTNVNVRPAVGSTRITSEIAGYSSGGISFDDGFLRLSAGGGTNANTKSYIDFSGFSTATDMNQNLTFGTAGTERMRIDASGRVGIGLTSPVSTLTVGNGILDQAGSKSTLTLSGASTAPESSARPGIYHRSGVGLGLFSDYQMSFQVNGSTSLVEAMRITDTGRIGIGGITNPTQATVAIGGSGVFQTGLVGAYINSSVAGNAVTHGNHGVSLYTSGTIWCGNTVIATSDARTKVVQGRSNPSADLQTLLKIEITDFQYKDRIAKGDSPQKKVIAQQVEKIFPQAVGQRTETVPDIYSAATYRDGWVRLANTLKPGEKVRLIGDKAEGIYEVLEAKPDAFRTAFVPSTDKIFVYGREVNDFRTVDYDAIAMLNVSATQELARENAALRAANAALEKRLAEVESKDRARDAKLASIEKLLQSASSVMAQPAKSATGTTQQ